MRDLRIAAQPRLDRLGLDPDAVQAQPPVAASASDQLAVRAAARQHAGAQQFAVEGIGGRGGIVISDGEEAAFKEDLAHHCVGDGLQGTVEQMRGQAGGDRSDAPNAESAGATNA